MYNKPYAILLYLSMTIMTCSSINAAKPVWLYKESLTQLKQSFFLIIPSIAESMASQNDSPDALQFISEHTDNNNITHVRMQQLYFGINVFGGYAIIHNKGGVRALESDVHAHMNGRVYKDLIAELGQPSQTLIQNTDLVLQNFIAQYQNLELSEPYVKPIVYIDAQNKAFWAYKVSVLIKKSNGVYERQTAILDANTNQPFKQWDDIKTSRTFVKGQGFGGNQKMGMYQYGVDRPFLKMSRDENTSMCFMENDDVILFDLQHTYFTPNSPMSFDCRVNNPVEKNIYWTGYKSDGYDLYNGAYSPANDALYFASVIKGMYHDWCDVTLKKLIIQIHYGLGYENAFWDGKYLTFGDGDARLYPLVSLGIAAHEISHSVTEKYSNLEYFDQSGGINESFSDIAAQAAEFYVTGKNSWSIGGDIIKKGHGIEALRYMDQPSRNGAGIDYANQYYTLMDPHLSSGVYNRLFYLLANKSGWDVPKAFRVMMKANMDYWTPFSTFDDGGCGIIQAASDLGFSINAVKQSLSEVGVMCVDT